MQNRYVGDVGDFGKYGLLRALCGTTESQSGADFKLGVVWYLVPDESHNADGKHVRYLSPTPANLAGFRACDPPLYDSLRRIIASGVRQVGAIQRQRVLPDGTVFYDRPLNFRAGTSTLLPKQARCTLREEWLAGALTATAACDLVFVDPDNGLEVGVPAFDRRGPKYVLYEELKPYVQRGQSVVVYHHTCRRGNAKEQVAMRLRDLKATLRAETQPFALLYHRGSSRAFLVLPTVAHREALLARTRRFLSGPWARHFELIEPGA